MLPCAWLAPRCSSRAAASVLLLVLLLVAQQFLDHVVDVVMEGGLVGLLLRAEAVAEVDDDRFQRDSGQ